ncbi:hypothetical protein EB118_04900 [bacterium]|nr:hypothetical protein [bacterium]NDC94176.1 hypothetical protein [bacterium]NDD82774.1 hypothetical protein [bacterium]NDG29425.1 hypothetical protein [bacterium]
MILYSSELFDSNCVTLVRKRQKNSSNTNIYISPSIGLILYKPTVSYVNEKYLVFQYNKTEHLSLLSLFRRISDNLSSIVKGTFFDLQNKHIYTVHSEQESTFTIRVSLPGSNKKYFVATNWGPFRLPRVGAIYDRVTIEFKNYWEKDDLIGMNTELKKLESNN